MTKITFISANGNIETHATGKSGDRLLDIAQVHDQPLEGTCEGQMACSTCHVIVSDEDFDKLPAAEELEEDMLDLAAGVARTSRLACQIYLTADMESLTVRMPSESHNMQGS